MLYVFGYNIEIINDVQSVLATDVITPCLSLEHGSQKLSISVTPCKYTCQAQAMMSVTGSTERN